MQRLTSLAFVGLALSLAACGTTVPQAQSASGVQSVAGNGLGPGPDGQLPADASNPALGVQAPGAPTSTTSATGGTAGAAGTAGGDGTATSSGTSATGGSTGSTAVQGRGVTATTITIGAAIATGTNEVADAFGISGAGSVSEKSAFDAVIADVNKSGGVLGRKLALYVHPVDLATFVANPERTYGEVCTDFKDDHPVFAAMITISEATLRACLAKMGTPLIVYGANVSSIVPAKAFSDYSNYLYVPGGTTQERLAELFVESMMANNFMAKWDTTKGGPGVAPVKLGVIHVDTPDQHHLYDAYARELAKFGLKFTDRVTYAQNAQDAFAATQGAVLKMKADGITHVFGASAFFLRDAESQHYRPRYAFLPGLGAFGAANSPAEQMAGAQTVGWAPTLDVDTAQDPGPTPGAARCARVMKAAGLNGNRQDTKMMFGVCDAVYSFQAALAAGQQASVPGLRRGYEALGTSFRPALTFGASLGPNRHYGVDFVRDMAYDSECSCLKYTSRTNRS
jgi:hypothetical protein